MGPNPNGPRSGSYDRVMRYSGFFEEGPWTLGPFVGDFVDPGNGHTSHLGKKENHRLSGALGWDILVSVRV